MPESGINFPSAASSTVGQTVLPSCYLRGGDRVEFDGPETVRKGFVVGLLDSKEYGWCYVLTAIDSWGTCIIPMHAVRPASFTLPWERAKQPEGFPPGCTVQWCAQQRTDVDCIEGVNCKCVCHLVERLKNTRGNMFRTFAQVDNLFDDCIAALSSAKQAFGDATNES